jgi:hypothetical protein
MTEKLERVTVTHPMTASVRGPHHGSQPVDARRDDAIGEVALRSMMRAQLRLALRWFTALILLLGTVFVLVAFVPVAWWLMGVSCFPMLGWIASRYVRAVERLERRFANLVGNGSGRTPER